MSQCTVTTHVSLWGCLQETVAGQAVETTQEAADSAVISTIPGLAGHSSMWKFNTHTCQKYPEYSTDLWRIKFFKF